MKSGLQLPSAPFGSLLLSLLPGCCLSSSTHFYYVVSALQLACHGPNPQRLSQIDLTSSKIQVTGPMTSTDMKINEKETHLPKLLHCMGKGNEPRKDEL